MIPIYLAIISILFGLLAPLWFGKLLPPVRKLRKGAQWIDPLPLTPPSTSLSIHELREYEKCGDKIVIAHHLADWTRDLQRKIFNLLAVNSVVLFVLVVFFTVKGDASLQKPDAHWRDVLVAVEANWPFSILLAYTFVEIIVFVKLVSDQAAKYGKVIDAARPDPKPLNEKIQSWFSRKH